MPIVVRVRLLVPMALAILMLGPIARIAQRKVACLAQVFLIYVQSLAMDG